MLDYLQFRFRRLSRSFRRRRLQITRATQAYVDRHLRGKWHQLKLVRRRLAVWWAIMAIALIGTLGQIVAQHHLAEQLTALSGGTYNEADVGTIQILNPILPEDGPAADVNRLVFSGLTQYNAKRQLVPDLATSWDTSADGKTYTFHLRHGVTFQDGVPFTADDVAFTLAAIQNPDTRSPLASSWQGVKAKVVDANTIQYMLPSPLASFIDSTTVGILPRHLLGDIDPSTMREASFNQHPVGTGPFSLTAFSPGANEMTLTANAKYYAGRPKLDNFVFHLYGTPSDALAAYSKHQVDAVGQVVSSQFDEASKLQGVEIEQLSLPQEETLFFRQGDVVAGDAAVREILIRSISQSKIIAAATAGQATAVKQPILPGQLGYTAGGLPAPMDLKAASAALDANGWRMSTDGVRKNADGRTLNLTVITLAGSELEAAAHNLAVQWKPLGVNLKVTTTDLTDLEQSYIRPRHYQLLLFGLNIGADPDVYAYWDSSQVNDPGLNLSQYKSGDADQALESGRVILDSATRAAKYRAFLKAWDADQPAAVLYQPAYLYAQDSAATGFAAKRIVTPADRFYGVQNWTIRQRWSTR